MPRPPAKTNQPDLLDWQAPEPTRRFEDRAVHAATVEGRIAKAVAAALVGEDRAEIAKAMSTYLGKTVSKTMLDAYASPAREEHVISLARFIALLQVTADRRLLELIAEPLGWAVIERRYLPLIELAAVREREDELRRQGDALRRQAKSRGVL